MPNDKSVCALRAQQSSKGAEIDPFKAAKLDRTRWEGCAYCTLRKVPRMPWYSPSVVVREGEYREADNSLSHIEECSLDGPPRQEQHGLLPAVKTVETIH